MTKKERAQQKEELRNLFSEVLQIAYSKASGPMKEFLDKASARFDELTSRKKGGNSDSAVSQEG